MKKKDRKRLAIENGHRKAQIDSLNISPKRFYTPEHAAAWQRGELPAIIKGHPDYESANYEVSYTVHPKSFPTKW